MFKINTNTISLLAVLSWPCALVSSEASPEIQAQVCSNPPIIDGKLDDQCWQEAYQTEEFYRMDTGAPAPEKTRVYIIYDQEALYVAFYCFDTEPDKIRSMQKKRGGMIWQDDVVEIGIDTYHAHRETYWLDVTAGGTQFEEIPGGSGTKIEWRGDWHAATNIVENGWIAEMSIPWSVLRFRKGTKVMGVYAARNLPRQDVWLSWPNLGSSWDSERMADLAGLELPDISHPPLLLPHFLGIVHDDDKNELSAGLNVKQLFGSGLTGSLTVNPDFKTIEDEVETIDFSYTERYLQDRRPFFTEGRDFFPNSTMFYSRRIEDVDAGVKLFGRTGKARIGLLDVVQDIERNDFVGRVAYDLTPESAIWFAGVHSATMDSSNATMGVGSSVHRKFENGGGKRVGVSLYQTVMGERKGNIVYANAGRWPGGTGGIDLNSYIKNVSEDYTSWPSYLPERNYWQFGLGTGVWKKYDNPTLKSWSSRVSVHNKESHADTLISRGVDLRASVAVRSLNTSDLEVGTYYNQRRAHNDKVLYAGLGWNREDIHQNGGIRLSYGQKAGNGYLFGSIEQGFRVASNLGINIRSELERLHETGVAANYESLFILTGNYDITNERGIGILLTHRGDSSSDSSKRMISSLGNGRYNPCITYRQAVRAGMDVFFVVGDPNAENTQKRFAIKLVRPLWNN